MTSTATRLRHSTLTVLLVLGTAGLLGGCAASAGQAPEPSASASATQAGPVWTTVPDSAAFKALTAEQQAKITSLDSMDMATFEQQSLEDQLAFGDFIREVYQDYAIASLAKAAPDLALPAPKELSKESTGQEILDDENLKYITAIYTSRPDPETAEKTEPGYMEKFAPSRASKSGWPTMYESLKGGQKDETKAEKSKTTKAELVDDIRSSFATKKATHESATYIPYPENGEHTLGGLTFKVVQAVNKNGGKNQFYFTYVPFTDIHGNEDGVWAAANNRLEESPDWIPDLPPAS